MTTFGVLERHERLMGLFDQAVFALWHERFEDDPGHRWLHNLLVEGLWRPAG